MSQLDDGYMEFNYPVKKSQKEMRNILWKNGLKVLSVGTNKDCVTQYIRFMKQDESSSYLLMVKDGRFELYEENEEYKKYRKTGKHLPWEWKAYQSSVEYLMDENNFWNMFDDIKSKTIPMNEYAKHWFNKMKECYKAENPEKNDIDTHVFCAINCPPCNDVDWDEVFSKRNE